MLFNNLIIVYNIFPNENVSFNIFILLVTDSLIYDVKELLYVGANLFNLIWGIINSRPLKM